MGIFSRWVFPLAMPALAALLFASGLFIGLQKGEQRERRLWEARQLTAERLQHESLVKDLNTAITVGRSIASALHAAAIAKAQIQTRTQIIVREVERENAALPNADTCLMPDAVVRLRDEQVRDSARAEEDARNYIRKRLDAVRKPNSG